MTRIRSTPADPGLNRTRFSSAIKGSPLKKKSAQCESISHCALENFIVPRSCRFSAFASLRSEHQDNFYPNPSPQKNQVNFVRLARRILFPVLANHYQIVAREGIGAVILLNSANAQQVGDLLRLAGVGAVVYNDRLLVVVIVGVAPFRKRRPAG